MSWDNLFRNYILIIITMSWSSILQKNKTSLAIFLFLGVFALIHMAKPRILYNENGSFRDFGVGYKHKTVFPIWVVAILLALGSYLFVGWMSQQDFT